jgi:hypothetical protein
MKLKIDIRIVLLAVLAVIFLVVGIVAREQMVKANI